MKLLKPLLLICLLLITGALGIFAGYTYHRLSFDNLEKAVRVLPASEYFHYSLPDKTEYARGIVEQVSPPVFFIRTSDEMLQIVTNGNTVFKTASYPLSLDQKPIVVNFNSLHTKDKVDVRFVDRKIRNDALNIMIWTNLRSQ